MMQEFSEVPGLTAREKPEQGHGGPGGGSSAHWGTEEVQLRTSGGQVRSWKASQRR